MRRTTVTLMMAAAAALLLACGGAEEEGASRIPPPPDQIVYDASAYDDIEDAALRAYLQGSDALAHDRYDEAHQAFTRLAAASSGALQPLAQAAADAGDIASARVAFKPLSTAIVEAELPEGILVAYCPMAFDYEGGHWAQRDGAIMNPYFGAQMLHCGVFEDPDEDGA